MRTFVLLLCAAVITGGGGCVQPMDRAAKKAPALNRRLVNSFNDAAIKNAIIVQHTLFPYCFEQDSSTLNQLGQHRLEVLAGHFKDREGQVNVRRGDVPEELYRARVERVKEDPPVAGVDLSRIKVRDALPGGPGMKSERVLEVKDRTLETHQNAERSGSFQVSPTTGVRR